LAEEGDFIAEVFNSFIHEEEAVAVFVQSDVSTASCFPSSWRVGQAWWILTAG
jgi:hypothetical protein